MPSLQMLRRTPQMLAQVMSGNMPGTGQTEFDPAMIAGRFAAGDRDQALAEALMGAGYVPNSGALGAIAQIASAFAGHKLKERGSKSIEQAMREQFAMENASRQRQSKEEAAAKEAELNQKIAALQGAGLPEGQARAVAMGVGNIRDFREDKPKQTTAQQNAAALGLKEGTPEYVQYIRQATERKGQNITVNAAPGQTAFDKELGKRDAGTFETWRNDAIAAEQAKDNLDRIEQILNAQQTGRMEEAMALAGQWLGTEAGANMQSVNKLIGPLILDAAQKLKPLSNSDVRFVEQMMPNFGSDPRANQQALSLLRSAADKQIGRFQSADKYVAERGSLRGFTPDFGDARSDGGTGGGGAGPKTGKQYKAGDVVTVGGKKYRVIGGDPDDPDLEEIP